MPTSRLKVAVQSAGRARDPRGSQAVDSQPGARGASIEVKQAAQMQALADQGMQRRANGTGLPEGLKAGVERLSGLSMDDVKVHANSSRPAQLSALAYTQGTDIHVAPGQERYLSHEAWHVVQQKQGRVRPTLQAGGVAINDDGSLEAEAHAMGARALQEKSSGSAAQELAAASTMPAGAVVQRAIGLELEAAAWQSRDIATQQDLPKGHKIFRGQSYSLTADETQDRSDIEFVTDPLTEGDELRRTVAGIVEWADWLVAAQKKAPAAWIPVTDKVEVQGTNDPELSAHVQATVGVPLEHLPALYDEFRGDMGTGSALRGVDRFKQVISGHAPGVAAPPTKANADALSGPVKGFALAVIDYLRQGFIPVNYRNQNATVFPKALFPVLPKTAIEQIFGTLPPQDRDLLSYQGWTGRYLRPEWVDWFIQAAIGDYVRASTGFFDSGDYDSQGKATLGHLKKEKLITAQFGNQAVIDISRIDWLTNIPNSDLFTKNRAMFGWGGLGSAKDELVQPGKGQEWAPNVPRAAPIFELRNLVTMNGNRTTWVATARDIGKRYEKAVGGYRYRLKAEPGKLI